MQTGRRDVVILLQVLLPLCHCSYGSVYVGNRSAGSGGRIGRFSRQVRFTVAPQTERHLSCLCSHCDVHQCFSNWAPQRGVRDSERRKCVMAEEFLLAVLNLYVRIEFRVETFYTNLSVTGSTQTINHCFNPVVY